MWDQAKIDEYLKQHPNTDPAENQLMLEAISADDYYDRGMWGPMGGKNGTPSELFMDEHDRLYGGGPSELSLMTVVTPEGDVMPLEQHAEFQAQQAAEREAALADYAAMEEDELQVRLKAAEEARAEGRETIPEAHARWYKQQYPDSADEPEEEVPWTDEDLNRLSSDLSPDQIADARKSQP